MYHPPLCETTGILIERCENIKLNNTTAKTKDVEVLKGLRFIEVVQGRDYPNLVTIYGLQQAKVYKLYLQSPDNVRIGDKIYFNKSSFWKQKAYDKTITDTIKLEIKQIDDFEINCSGYIEVIAVSYN